jgi:hypothetical protein
MRLVQPLRRERQPGQALGDRQHDGQLGGRVARRGKGQRQA